MKKKTLSDVIRGKLIVTFGTKRKDERNALALELEGDVIKLLDWYLKNAQFKYGAMKNGVSGSFDDAYVEYLDSLS